MMVHMSGAPGDIENIADICKENEIYLLEDFSQANGAGFKGRHVGSFVDIGIAVVNIGHSVKEILAAMLEQAKKACFIYNGQFITEPAINLARKIVGLTPAGLSRVFLVSGGSVRKLLYGFLMKFF